MGYIGLVEGSIVLFIILCGAIWLWALIDCLRYEPAHGNEKLIWVIVIIFTYIIGALLYLLIRRPQRKMQLPRP